MAEARGRSVRHHPGGWIPPDDSRTSSPSASHARFGAWPGYDPSPVRYALAVGNHRWPGFLLLSHSVKVARSPRVLWSDMVVSLAVIQLGRDRLLRRCRLDMRGRRSRWRSGVSDLVQLLLATMPGRS
jgi:hypothetical protein